MSKKMQERMDNIHKGIIVIEEHINDVMNKKDKLQRLKRSKIGITVKGEYDLVQKHLLDNPTITYFFSDQVKHFGIAKRPKPDKFYINTKRDINLWITMGNLMSIKGIYDPDTDTEFLFGDIKQDIMFRYFADLLRKQHPDVRVGGFGMLEEQYSKNSVLRIFIRISHIVANIDIIKNMKPYDVPTPR